MGTMKNRAKQNLRPGISKSSLISSHHERLRWGIKVDPLMLSWGCSSGIKGSSSSSRGGKVSTGSTGSSLVTCRCLRDSGINHTRMLPKTRVPQAISNESHILTRMKKAAEGGAMRVQT